MVGMNVNPNNLEQIRAYLIEADKNKTWQAIGGKSSNRGKRTRECQLPKLDVAGSIPVSRSFQSITWAPSFTVLPQNYRIKRKLSGQVPIRAVEQLRFGSPDLFGYRRSGSRRAYGLADRRRPSGRRPEHA